MTEGALSFKEQRIAGAQADANAFVLRLEAYEHAPGLTKFRLQLVKTLSKTCCRACVNLCGPAAAT